MTEKVVKIIILRVLVECCWPWWWKDGELMSDGYGELGLHVTWGDRARVDRWQMAVVLDVDVRSDQKCVEYFEGFAGLQACR